MDIKGPNELPRNQQERPLMRSVIKEELYILLKRDHVKALILNQMLYWSERMLDFDRFITEERERAKEDREDIHIDLTYGWIFKKAEELSNEIMIDLSKSGMLRHIKDLVDAGYLDQRRNPKNKMDKTYQYRVNIRKIQQDLLCMGLALEGYRIPLDFVTAPTGESNNRSSKIELRDSTRELRSSILELAENQQNLRSSKIELRDSILELRSSKIEPPSSTLEPPSSILEQQYQRLLSESTTEITEDEVAYAREGEVISASPIQALGDEVLATPRKPRLPKRIRITRTYTKAREESDSSGDLSDVRENGGQDDLWRAVDQGQASPSEHDSFGELAPTAEVSAGGDLNPQDKPSPDQPGEPEGMAQLENLAISLLQRPLLTGDELHMIAELLEQGVPVATMVRGIQESFEAFVPRYTGDRIKRLTYCRDRIVELHEASARPSVSSQKPGRRYGGGGLRQRNETKSGDAANVQPGKYEQFYAHYPHLRKRE